ncbi:CRISPR-associated endonuclease Cas2 [Listeria grandensis]|uniref:CRISPR-associated endoribonuclease Cas2 n=1 Tax=Listeria grandensis TaxID=1494963 RepID=A0A7X0Y4Q7_9LIST|nr:CRISPR-associated endonuclease Cas2 [Listeria grandensis]MBC1475724.1 CRISPR-associated endonuclease Cas2 [Listeria grandensis]MBC1936823.1 CRISPR-associated endonuclease Cas2 [Listeria grandensis]MBC6314492.1 CRISPR-associated endonuclease Cas2 [Listeria grandensis]
MYIILIYDITQDNGGAKVSRNIFKICKKYLTHVQKSVFEGEITPPLLVKLRMELDQYIREEEDSVIVFSSRQERWLEKEFWGAADEKTSNFF